MNKGQNYQYWIFMCNIDYAAFLLFLHVFGACLVFKGKYVNGWVVWEVGKTLPKCCMRTAVRVCSLEVYIT